MDGDQDNSLMFDTSGACVGGFSGSLLFDPDGFGGGIVGGLACDPTEAPFDGLPCFIFLACGIASLSDEEL